MNVFYDKVTSSRVMFKASLLCGCWCMRAVLGAQLRPVFIPESCSNELNTGILNSMEMSLFWEAAAGNMSSASMHSFCISVSSSLTFEGSIAHSLPSLGPLGSEGCRLIVLRLQTYSTLCLSGLQRTLKIAELSGSRKLT